MASLPAELKSLIAAHLTAPAPCCPAHDLAALSLASAAWAAAARPHLLAIIPLSARTTPAFLPLLHPPSHNGKQISSTIPAHAAHLAFEDTAAANMLLPRCAPLAHLRSMELRNLEWAALSPDATAPLMSVFQALTALAIHRAAFPHAQTLRRLVASFPALERLALSDISVAPCLCNAYQPSERAAAMTVPKGLRSLTLDMGVAATGKRSQAEELLEWLANGSGCEKLATLDVRGLTRASFPALAHFLSALPELEHLRLAFLEDIGADDLEATPIHLQSSLKTLSITAPSLASAILLLPSLPIIPSPRAPQTAALTLTLPSLGPAHLRRLPWAKLTPLLPAPSPSPSPPSAPALKVRVYGWPESILASITRALSHPSCLGAPSLPRAAWSAEAFSRTYALESDADADGRGHGYPHTRAQRKAGRAASISLALRRLPAAAPGAADSSTIAGYTAGALALFAGGASVGGMGLGSVGASVGATVGVGMGVSAETAGRVGEALGAVGGAVGKAFPWLLLAPVVLAGGVMYAGGLGGHDDGDEEE